MNQAINALKTVPTVNITVNKSRLKVYKNEGEHPTYYLQKGTEFQIELANTTTDVVMAKIILNGKIISQGGLVLNPGQRVFLERYLDVAKKFLFDTYEVSNSNEMKEAIVNNGDIKVEFYRELDIYIPIQYYKPSITFTTLGNYGTGTDPQYLTNTTTSSLYSSTGSIVGNTSTSNVTYTSSIDNQPVKKTLKRSIETGRVEKGGDSEQELKSVNKIFEYVPFHTIEYKLLPTSQKINTTKDINVKVYCTNCGAKLGKTDKFCSSCGTKK